MINSQLENFLLDLEFQDENLSDENGQVELRKYLGSLESQIKKEYTLFNKDRVLDHSQLDFGKIVEIDIHNNHFTGDEKKALREYLLHLKGANDDVANILDERHIAKKDVGHVLITQTNMTALNEVQSFIRRNKSLYSLFEFNFNGELKTRGDYSLMHQIDQSVLCNPTTILVDVFSGILSRKHAKIEQTSRRASLAEWRTVYNERKVSMAQLRIITKKILRLIAEKSVGTENISYNAEQKEVKYPTDSVHYACALQLIASKMLFVISINSFISKLIDLMTNSETRLILRLNRSYVVDLIKTHALTTLMFPDFCAPVLLSTLNSVIEIKEFSVDDIMVSMKDTILQICTSLSEISNMFANGLYGLNDQKMLSTMNTSITSNLGWGFLDFAELLISNPHISSPILGYYDDVFRFQKVNQNTVDFVHYKDLVSSVSNFALIPQKITDKCWLENCAYSKRKDDAMKKHRLREEKTRQAISKVNAQRRADYREALKKHDSFLVERNAIPSPQLAMFVKSEFVFKEERPVEISQSWNNYISYRYGPENFQILELLYFIRYLSLYYFDSN